METLADVEFRVTSQWGEDGIIEWLVHRLPGIERSFIEFGVEDFSEANTRFLLEHRSWRGLVIDGSASHMAHVRSQAVHWRHDLVCVAAFVTAETIDELIRAHGFAGEPGLLSIDIDGNDYWVLEAIDCVRPAILIVEINGVFGDRHAITIPYDPAFERLRAHPSGQYFGASIRAVVRSAGTKGYAFLGTNSNGISAFFVREDLAGRVLPAIRTVKAWPPRHRDARDAAGNLIYTRGTDKAALTEDMVVQDVESGRQATLASLQPLYSDTWAREI